MLGMGFNDQWISRMEECLSTTQISVLVNGSPTLLFNMQRGVRQRDAILPFLFLIEVKGLKCLLDKAKQGGLFEGIFINHFVDSLSLLHFADDTLIFIPAELDRVKNLRRVLWCFEIISGLKINFHKSSIVGLNVDSSLQSLTSSVLGCKTDSLPTKYLGLPLSNIRITLADWAPLINKVQQRLALWQGPLLSSGGRLTLIKVTVASIPIYYMSLFALPKVV